MFFCIYRVIPQNRAQKIEPCIRCNVYLSVKSTRITQKHTEKTIKQQQTTTRKQAQQHAEQAQTTRNTRKTSGKQEAPQQENMKTSL